MCCAFDHYDKGWPLGRAEATKALKVTNSQSEVSEARPTPEQVTADER
jgi:hypothetical protein